MIVRDTYSGDLAAEHIEQRTVILFLGLGGAVTKLDLKLRWDAFGLGKDVRGTVVLQEFGVVCAGCSLVACVVRCLCQTICRWRRNLNFPA